MSERELMDTDGENRAVRWFLALYSGTNSPTIEQMRKHLDACGFPLWPAWAQFESGHLTKGGAQDWLRHLFSLEQQAQTAPVVPEGWLVCKVCGGDATHNTVTVEIDGKIPRELWTIGFPAYLSAAPSAPIAANSEDAKDCDSGFLERIAKQQSVMAHTIKDAERYRWLRERFIGFDFYFGGDPLAEKEEDRGVITINFEVPKGFNCGRDIDAPIDAAIAATAQQKKEGE